MKRIIIAVLALLSSITGAATAVVTTPGGWDLYLGASLVKGTDGNRLPPFDSESACIVAAVTRSTAVRSYKYQCRTRTAVDVTTTKDPVPTCPAKPADDTQNALCPIGTTGSWPQSRSYTSAAYPTCWTAGAWTPADPPAGACTPIVTPPDPTPTGATWTDLASAPSCAKVTTYPAKTVSTPEAAGIPLHAGNCLNATASTLGAVWDAAKPGDVITLAAGVYTGQYGTGSWFGSSNLETYKKGTAAQPIALVAAPGAAVEFRSPGRPSFIFGNGDAGAQNGRTYEKASYITLAGFKITAPYTCVSGAGNTTDPKGGPDETGGDHIRMVGIDCVITDANENTMTGLVDLQADGWKLLGNTFTDPANRTVINNNHGVYIQGGADDVEVAYNTFKLHVGHVVQIHQDGAFKQYDRLSVHDNTFQGVNYGDMRGISVIRVTPSSTVSIVGNKFRHQGQGGWGCVNVYGGIVTIAGLDCVDSQGGVQLNNEHGQARKVTLTDSKICPAAGYPRTAFEQGAKASELTETGAKSCP